MAVSVTWGTKVVYVPKADLTLDTGVYYTYNISDFREELLLLEESAIGMGHLKITDHTPAKTLSGVNYAKFIEIINGYTVEFEDGQYVVTTYGANHNTVDVKVHNQVSVITNNSAGLIEVATGSGVTQQDKEDIAALVWDEVMAGHLTQATVGGVLHDILWRAR